MNPHPYHRETKISTKFLKDLQKEYTLTIQWRTREVSGSNAKEYTDMEIETKMEKDILAFMNRCINNYCYLEAQKKLDICINLWFDRSYLDLIKELNITVIQVWVSEQLGIE